MSIDKDIKGYAARLSKYSKKDLKAATASALSKTAAKARTRTIRGVAKAAKLPVKTIRKKVYVKRATINKLRARLSAYRNPVSLIGLKPRQTKRGRKNGGVRAGKHFFKGAFIVRGKQVFKRKGSARLPIEVQRIHIQKTVDDIALKVTVRVMKKDFKKILSHELRFRLSKHRPGT